VLKFHTGLRDRRSVHRIPPLKDRFVMGVGREGLRLHALPVECQRAWTEETVS
jgi:hypothetical protein